MKRKIIELIKFFSIILFNLKIYPKKFEKKLKRLKKIKLLEKEFSSEKYSLVYGENKIYRPKNEIDNKLWNEYLNLVVFEAWHSNTLLRHRDIKHFEEIGKIYPDIHKKKLKILNFGAGHGGISILFNILGHHVVNYDPVKMLDDVMKDNWNCITSLDNLDETFDFVYNSHGFTAVNNLGEELQKLANITNGNTFFFIEESIKTKFNNSIPKFRPPRINYFIDEKFFKNIFINVDKVLYLKQKSKKNGLIERIETINHEDADLIQIFTKSKLKTTG